MSKLELLISTDVETLGRFPGLQPMLSIGAVALTRNYTVISKFSVNLELVEDLTAEPATVEWWSDPEKAEAWEETRRNAVDPTEGMWKFRRWLEELQGAWDLAIMAKPAPFDLGWIQYYLKRFTGGTPITRWRAYDIHTAMSIITGIPVNQLQGGMKDLPAEMLEQIKYFQGTEHVGVDDALYQGMAGVLCLNTLDKWRTMRASESRLKAFMFLLMRDSVPTGNVAKHILDLAKEENFDFSGCEELANLADSYAQRVIHV